MKKIVQVLLFLLLLAVPLHAQQDSTRKDTTITTDTVVIYRTRVARIAPPVAVTYVAPAFYRKLWKQAMECTDLWIPMSQTEKVQWNYVVADAFTMWDNSATYAGYTLRADDRIILIYDGIDDARLIKHEMVHYLMWIRGEQASHPDKYFKKCGLLRP